MKKNVEFITFDQYAIWKGRKYEITGALTRKEVELRVDKPTKTQLKQGFRPNRPWEYHTLWVDLSEIEDCVEKNLCSVYKGLRCSVNGYYKKNGREIFGLEPDEPDRDGIYEKLGFKQIEKGEYYREAERGELEKLEYEYTDLIAKKRFGKRDDWLERRIDDCLNASLAITEGNPHKVSFGEYDPTPNRFGCIERYCSVMNKYYKWDRENHYFIYSNDENGTPTFYGPFYGEGALAALLEITGVGGNYHGDSLWLPVLTDKEKPLIYKNVFRSLEEIGEYCRESLETENKSEGTPHFDTIEEAVEYDKSIEKFRKIL